MGKAVITVDGEISNNRIIHPGAITTNSNPVGAIISNPISNSPVGETSQTRTTLDGETNLQTNKILVGEINLQISKILVGETNLRTKTTLVGEIINKKTILHGEINRRTSLDGVITTILRADGD